MDTSELEQTLPPWLQDARGTSAPEETSPEAFDEEDDDPDWLQRIRALEAEEIVPEEPSSEKSISDDTDLPAWLQGLGEEEEKTLFFEEDIEESTLNEEVSPELLGEDEQSDQEGDLPDWILEMRSGERDHEPAEEAATVDSSPTGTDVGESPSGEVDVPDWLDEEEEDAQEADLPEWLLAADTGDESGMPDLVGKTETVEPSPTGADVGESPFGEVDVPDWLDEEEEDAQEADLPEWLLGADTGDESGMPDLVGKTETVEPSPTGTDVGESPFGEDDTPDWFDEDEDEEDTPEEDLSEWFSAVNEDVDEVEEREETTEEDLPDWLLEEDLTGEEPEEVVDSASPFVEEGGDAVEEDIFADDLPQWLVDASDEELAEEGLSSEDLDEIRPGELPGWVEAMRPVKAPSQEDAELFDEADAYVENSGPLAGIANILPAEAGVIKTPKAPKRSFKLNVTESQQRYVSLLEDLIASERESGVVLTQPLLSTQRVLRWLIALVLFLSIGLTFFSPVAWFSYPFYRAETRSVNDAIQSLPEASPVLVAFDYEPALSGEMNAIAAGVVDHLMLEGAYLTFVSTSPTGPVLVENFLKTTQAEHNYTHGQQYVNLGYIPGKAAGLLSFVIAPQNIMPLAFDGADAWEMRPLQEVVTLADFSMVLVITDDSDTARMWIEQVQPRLEDTPLMMAVSAQAEPLVRPYYEAIPRQVTGLVSGLPGGASYEQLTGRSSLAHEYWSAYNVGIIVTVVVLLISGIVNVFSSRRDRKRGHTGEER